VISHAIFFVTLPLVTLSLGFAAVDRSLVEAAATMGADDRTVFRTIVVPLILPYLVSGLRLRLRVVAERIYRRLHDGRLHHGDPADQDLQRPALRLHADHGLGALFTPGRPAGVLREPAPTTGKGRSSSSAGRPWLFDIAAAEDDAPALRGRAAGRRPRARRVCGEAARRASPYNVAVGLARLGRRVEFLTGLADDVLGRRLLGYMEAAGIGLEHAVASDRPTAFSIVDLDERGVPAYAFYPDLPAYCAVTAADLPELGPEIGAVHFGSIAAVLPPMADALAELARREKTSRLLSYDPNVRLAVVPDAAAWRARIEALADCVHLLKISAEDIELLYQSHDHEAMAARWLDQGVRLVVITRGGAGAAAWTRHCRVALPAREVAVVDTVGAGDSYQAALLAGLAEAGRLDPDGLASLDEAALRGLAGLRRGGGRRHLRPARGRPAAPRRTGPVRRWRLARRGLRVAATILQ
jgi:fructokinase